MSDTQAIREMVFRRYKAYVRHATKHDLLERYIAQWLDEKRATPKVLDVLDIGAGTGRLGAALLKAAKQRSVTVNLVAVEPCQSTALELRKTLSNYAVAGNTVSVRENVFEELESGFRGQFDLVLASHVSYYFADLASFVSDAIRATKDGGEVLFIGTSTTIMQNDVYQTLYRQLRRNTLLPRTLESDGFFTFGENLELELIDQNARFAKSSMSSTITFELDEIAATVRALEEGAPGPVLEAMAFLWRYPDAAMLTIREEWLDLLMRLLAAHTPLVLAYDDIALMASR